MAQYLLTDSPTVNWPDFDWTNATLYNWRHENDGGQPFVQEELDHRIEDGVPVVLWRFDKKGEPPVLMEQHNV